MAKNEFVDAYSKTTGVKHRIPATWIGHPVLGRDFAQTPQAQAAERLTTGPDDTWKVSGLKDYAESHGIDVTGVSLKADFLAAIEAATAQTPPTDQVDEKTPATGDSKEN